MGAAQRAHVRAVDGLRAFGPVPAGILFKSASTRGGVIENISIRSAALEGVATAVSITLNWNPSYSYAKMPLARSHGAELSDIQIESKTAGRIANTKNWTFRELKVQTADVSSLR